MGLVQNTDVQWLSLQHRPMLCCALQGLEDQLLALVVNKERPDLEETKTQLIIQNTEFTIKLKQLEDELLYKLSTAEGDITGPQQCNISALTGCQTVDLMQAKQSLLSMAAIQIAILASL